MNNKTILFAAGVVLLAASVFTFMSVNRTNDPMDDLVRANVEALAQTESGLRILCDNYSYVIICKYTCLCGRTWTTREGYGYSKGLSGTCTCGRRY